MATVASSGALSRFLNCLRQELRSAWSSSFTELSAYRVEAPTARAFAHPPDRLKLWKPTSPGQRGRITVDRYNLWKGGPWKQLTKGITNTGGRNNTGRTTVWHKGGRHKRLYRLVDFQRLRADGVVKRIEYDPNRSARIALIKVHESSDDTLADDAYKGFRYIIAPEGLGIGDAVSSAPDAPIRAGMCKKLLDIPTGTFMHGIELQPGRGAKMCRAAGTHATLIKNGDDGYTLVQLPSGEQRYIKSTCRATIGTVSNPQHANRKLGGKSKKLRKTPWGKNFMGVKTRNPRKTSTNFIQLTRHQARALARNT